MGFRIDSYALAVIGYNEFGRSRLVLLRPTNMRQNTDCNLGFLSCHRSIGIAPRLFSLR